MNDSNIPPEKMWKYAKLELERCFLLPNKPSLPETRPAKQLKDKYLIGTHLRLRKSFEGENNTFKLTKKLALASGEQHWVSTIYLSEAEYQLFLQLPGHELEKKRNYYQFDTGPIIGVDELHLDGKKIYLAEVEFEDAEVMAAYKIPIVGATEVTQDCRYTGYELAKQ